MRRVFRKAGERFGWAEVAALSEDPVKAVSGDVKKMVKSGVRALERDVAEEVAEKKTEAGRILEVIETVQEMAADPDVEYPTEIEYTRTAKRAAGGYSTKTETLKLTDPDQAVKAAKKIEKSLPRWQKVRDEAVQELKRRQEALAAVGGSLSDLVRAWHGLLRDVLVTMP